MNSCNDIVLKKRSAKYYFKFLKWDSDFFGLNSYYLQENKSNLFPEISIIKLLDKNLGTSFITAKLNSAISNEKLSFLQRLGFKYIDLEVTLLYQPLVSQNKKMPEGVSFEELFVNEGLPYKQLGGAFTNTRFHSDKRIAKEKADLLWIRYLKNFIPGPGNRIFVAKVDKKIVSVILVCKDKKANTARLYFVATRKEFQNKGIGSGLIKYVISKFRQKNILVGTQGKNLQALNFYLRNGFTKVNDTKIVMHRWQD